MFFNKSHAKVTMEGEASRENQRKAGEVSFGDGSTPHVTQSLDDQTTESIRVELKTKPTT